MANIGVREAVLRYTGSRGKTEYILSKVTGIPAEQFKINEQNVKVLKEGINSSVASLTLRCKDTKTSDGEREEKVLIKYFGKNNGRGKRHKDFTQSTIDICSFLGENIDFPEYYFSETTELGTFLILQQIGETTLYDMLEQHKGKDGRRYIIQSVLPHISRFQINATKSLGKLIREKKISQTKFNSIFGKRPTPRRIVDYLRAVKGKRNINEVNSSLRKQVLKLSVPIQQIYAPQRGDFRVAHGDTIPRNIISMEETRRYGFIDSEACIGDPILDLAALLAAPEIDLKPRDWNSLVGLFVENDTVEQSTRRVNLNSIRKNLVQKLEELGVRFSDEERPGNLYFYNLMGIFFRSGRILAKVLDLENFYPRVYERMQDYDPNLETVPGRMKKKMSLSLGSVVNNPEEFKISKGEHIENLTKLYKVLKNQGIIESVEEFSNK